MYFFKLKESLRGIWKKNTFLISIYTVNKFSPILTSVAALKF